MLRLLAFCTLLVAVMGQASAASIIYNLIDNNPGTNYAPTANKLGDEIIVGGTDRNIVQVDFLVYAPNGYTGNLEFGFDNADASGNPTTNIATYNAGFSFGAGAWILSIGIPQITVPDDFYVFWDFTDYGTGNDPGLFVGGSPNPGASYDDFYNYDLGGLYWFGGNPTANFGIRLTAVPEPATMAVFGLGLAALIRRKRK